MKLKSMNNKRGELQVLYSYIMWFILIAILLGIGLLVLTKVADKINTSGGALKQDVAYTSVNTTIKEVGGYADWFGIIVIVTVAALILGIVLRAFVFRTRPGA